MLNPQLYNALLRTFGKVEIANEGVHATIAVDPSGLGSWSIAKDGEGSEEYRVNCPFCKDHKGHLYISHMSYAAPIVNGMQLQVGRLLAHCFRRISEQNAKKNPFFLSFSNEMLRFTAFTFR